jgi:homeobox protein cut-like
MAQSASAASAASSSSSLDPSGALSATLQFWETFNFPARRLWLDEAAMQVAERQERSAKARKSLADDTKEFKKDASADFNPLLRSYQKEIDEVTKRARAAESGLSELYQALRDAPDPAAWLAETARLEAEAGSLRFEHAKLSAEVQEFEAEFGKLKNQDITIRQLQDTIAGMQDEMEAKVAQAVESRAAEIETVALEQTQEKMHEWEELLAKVDVAEREAVDQRRAADLARSELYDMRARLEEHDSSRAQEVELLQEELAHLRASSGQHVASNVQSDIDKLRERQDDVERRRREEELAKAYLALDAARLEASRAREAEQDASRRRERETEDLRAKLEDKLSRERERVAELQARLERLSSEPAAREEPVEDKSDSRVAELETQLASTRLGLGKRDAELAAAKQTLLKLEERVDDQSAVIKKMQHESASVSALGPPGGDVLSIVQEQRDRFRRRMLELESELDTHAVQNKRLGEALERARAESSGLHERLRLARAQSGGDRFPARGAPSLDASSLGVRVARIVLANPVARSLVAGYVFILHLLVMATTAHASSGATGTNSLRGGAR